jgi:hypothetical protein
MDMPFRATDGGVRVELGPDELDVLITLMGEVEELLDDGGEETDPLEALVGVDAKALEREILREETGEGTKGDGVAPVQEDPALRRLLPDASRDDPAAAREFRRLTEFGLRVRKRSALATARTALTRPRPAVLDGQEAAALARALTDVRLVLGQRLGVETDEDAEAVHALACDGGPDEGTDEGIAVLATVYEVLTWWQEALLHVMTAR